MFSVASRDPRCYAFTYREYMSGIAEKYRSTYIRFRPPKNNRAFITFVQHVILPIIMPMNTGIETVEISREDLERLKSLRGRRVILTPNHSEGNEPYVLFHLSRLLGDQFCYLTAREVFERYFPAGRLLQAVGCYSVIRGAPDRNAFRTTRDLLVEGKHWVVAFPEGIAAGMGDVVMPFEEGVARIAFSACEELSCNRGSEPVYFQPLAVKPVCTGTMTETIDKALGRLEQAVLKTGRVGDRDFPARLLRLGGAVFGANEQAFGLRTMDGAPLSERFTTLKRTMLSRIGGAVGLPARPGQTESEYIRDLFNAIDRIVYTGKGENRYQEKLSEELRLSAKPLYHILLRVFQFVAFDTRYFDENRTVERFLDVLGLLEHEVFGRRRFYGPRTALVRVGEPLNLGDWMERYRKDRKGAIGAVTARLRFSVQAMLNTLSARSNPLVSPDFGTSPATGSGGEKE